MDIHVLYNYMCIYILYDSTYAYMYMYVYMCVCFAAQICVYYICVYALPRTPARRVARRAAPPRSPL